MRPEAALAKSIRIAVEQDGRARVVPNPVGLYVSWALVSRARTTGDWSDVAKTHPIACGLGKGSSDLVGILKGGRALALEVKMPSGRMQPEQPLWLAAVRKWGGFAAVVRSPAEAIAAIDRAERGADQ
jgi:VRR-NUC domain